MTHTTGAGQSVTIVVAAFEQIGGLVGQRSWSVWYFGREYGRMLELAAMFGDRSIVSVGDAVNAVALRMRDAFLNLDRHLASGRFRLSWLASDIAERNPYTSDLMLDVCRTMALIEAARGGGAHLVVVDDWRRGRAIAQCCRRAGLAARWTGPRLAFLRNLRSGLVNHVTFLREWWRERRALANHRCDPSRLAERDVLLMSWFDGTGLPNDGPPTNNRFFGSLADWLRKAGVSIAWIDNPIASARPVVEIAAASLQAGALEPRMLVGAVAGFAALVKAYAGLLMLPFALRRNFALAGIDLGPLRQAAVAREMMSPRLFRAAVYADLARVLKRRRIHPRALVYTFENQPWEKAMLVGFRRHLPGTLLVGVHHAPFDEGFIGCHPSSRQWGDGSTPDVLMTLGEEFRDRLLALGAPCDRLVVGGALRFPHIRSGNRAATAREPGAQRRILAACSIDFHESLELSHKAVLATGGIEGLRLVISLHPMVSGDFRADIRRRISQLVDCSHVEFAEGGAAQSLATADVLLYDSTSTAFEAAALAVPCIYVANSSSLELDVMAGNGVLKCRKPSDLRLNIMHLLNDPDLRRSCVDSARAYIDRCFSVPQPDVWVATVGHGLKRCGT